MSKQKNRSNHDDVYNTFKLPTYDYLPTTNYFDRFVFDTQAKIRKFIRQAFTEIYHVSI